MKFTPTISHNLKTIRLLLSVPLFYFIIQNNYFAALITFFAAIATEIDGTVARRFKQETDFGAVYDPIVDGIFIAAGFVALLIVGVLPVVLIGLLILVNIPRMVFMKLFYQKQSRFRSTFWSKLSGLLATLIIPLVLIDFLYLEWFIIGIIMFTGIIMIKRWFDYRNLLG